MQYQAMQYQAMQYQLEVVILPVADVDRSLAFYTGRLGFALDVDHRPADDFRVVQLTPPGSSCSIQLEPGTTGPRTHYLVAPDIEAARRDLRARGVDVVDLRHKSPIEAWAGGWEEGLDPERRDYSTFADVLDPDGNRWVLQERGYRRPA